MTSNVDTAEETMSAWQFEKLAVWFERQSKRCDLSLAEQLMLENVSAWLRSQERAELQPVRRPDPWLGLSNE